MSLAVALTKGRLEKSVTAMLEECGYGVQKLKDKGRALVFEDTVKDIRYFLQCCACFHDVHNSIA